MADYTYQELMKMQNDAIRRVEDMQKRARRTAGIEREEKPHEAPDTVKRIPQSGYLQQNGTGEKQPLLQEKSPSRKAEDSRESGVFEKIKNGIGELNIDSDKALLLSLIMLLSEEKADELLIMALIYMLN